MQTQEIKGNLARLLATENLIVEHRKVSTASFDVDARVLTLPMWDRASGIVYDMLVGHEVGHALFTPNEDWRSVADCPRDYVNVVEDARIEKLMKRKFPGLKKSFAGGYKELNDRDFFAIEDQDVSKFSLIDRINLHFKIGASALIPFSIEEKVFVARTDIAETFEEVLQIAQDVYEFSNQTEETSIEISAPPEASDENEEDDDQESNEDTEESTSEQSSVEPQPFTQGNQNLRSIEEDEDEIEEDAGSQGGETSETQRSFNDAAEELSSPHGRSPVYVEIPDKVDLDNFVVDWTTIHDWIDSQALSPEIYEEVDLSYQEFRKSSQKEVNYLVKEFECKKSADAYARAGQSKTGVLDTTKLHTYRYNEDIFKKITVLPDGKNHGLLFLLDWSGSMQNEILDTVKQLLNLTAFCKKVQIPFEVYAFTNEWIVADRAIKNDTNSYYDSYEYDGIEKNTVYLSDDRFHLMNFISSRSNSRNYERMCRNLYREASYYRSYRNYQPTLGISLSGTPLNEAIVMLNYIIPEFKQNNDLQKVNVCILSDGDGSSLGYGHEIYMESKDEYKVVARRLDWYQVLRDRKTGITYEQFTYDNVTNIFIKQLRDRNSGVNVVGFRILSGGQLNNFISKYADDTSYTEVQKQWKKEKSAIIARPKAYNALYAISNNSLNSETELTVQSGAQKAEISRAFKKMLKNKSSNKKLLSSFIGYVS